MQIIVVIFMDAYAGCHGKVHHAPGFTNSDVYKKGRQCTLFPDWKKTYLACRYVAM